MTNEATPKIPLLGGVALSSASTNAKPSVSGFALERTNDGAKRMPEFTRAEQSAVHEDDDGVVYYSVI